MTRAVCAAVALAFGMTAPAAAQPSSPGRVEVAIGAGWFGGVSMTPLAITETQSNGTPRTVFALARQLTSAAGADARIAVRVSSHWDVEATGSYVRPQLQLVPSNDVEGAAPVTAGERLQEFTVGGGVSWFFVDRDSSTRTLPFVIAGVAYVRQLHETSTLADDGLLAQAGGGIERMLWWHDGHVKGVGIRADARARVRPKALAVDGRTHVAPVIAASLVVRF